MKVHDLSTKWANLHGIQIELSDSVSKTENIDTASNFMEEVFNLMDNPENLMI